MHNGVNRVVSHHFGNQRCIADISGDKLNSPAFLERCQTGAVARVREGIQYDNVILRVAIRPVVNEVRTNKPRTTGNNQRSSHALCS